MRVKRADRTNPALRAGVAVAVALAVLVGIWAPASTPGFAYERPTGAAGAAVTFPSGLTVTGSATGAMTTPAGAASWGTAGFGYLASDYTPAPGADTPGFSPGFPTNVAICLFYGECTTSRGTLTYTFSQPVLNPRMHIEAMGGANSNGITTNTTSAILTLTTPGISASVISGRNLQVTGGNRIELVNKASAQSCNHTGTTPAPPGCGTVQLTGLVTAVTFSVTSWMALTSGPANPLLPGPDTFPVTFTVAQDYGDAPATYDQGNAARAVQSNLRMGPSVSEDNAAVANGVTSPLAGATASQDTFDDGVTLPRLSVDTTSYTATVAIGGASKAGTVCGWIDRDRSGTFTTSERVCASFAAGATTATLTWTGLTGLTPGDTYARFRIGYNQAQTSSPTGASDSGEVEDYRLTIHDFAAMELDKEVTANADEDASGTVTVGDTLTYTLTARNTGNAVLTGVVVTDHLTGQSTTCATVAIGASCVLTTTYVVTSTDFDAREVVNTATATSNETPPADAEKVVPVRSSSACPPSPIWVNSGTDLVLREYTFDTAGNLIAAPDIPVTTAFGDIAFDADGTTLYGVNFEGANPLLYTIDPVSGAITGTTALIPPAGQTVDDVNDLNALTVAEDGRLYVSGFSQPDIWIADPGTGQLELAPVAFGTLADGSQLVSSGDFLSLDDGDVLAIAYANDASYLVRFDFDAHTSTVVGSIPIMYGAAQSGGLIYLAAEDGTLFSLDAVPTAPSEGPITLRAEVDTAIELWGATSMQDSTGCEIPGLALEKQLTGNADEDASQSVTRGDTLTYTLTATNTGNIALTDVTVSDDLTGESTVCPLVGVGETCVLIATYVVVQADADAGTVDNTGTADADETPPTYDDVTVPVVRNPSISLVKSADLVEITVAGQTVAYEFVVENTGDVTLTDIVVNETDFTGSGAMTPVSCPAGPLAPGDTITCTASYQTTQADIDSGALTNTAVATATPPDPLEPPVSPPSTVTIPVPSRLDVQILKVGEAQTGEVVAMDGSQWAIYDAVDAQLPVVGPVAPAMDAGEPVTGLFLASLYPGAYWLEETKALAGFELLAERVPFTVSADGSVQLGPDAPDHVSVVDVEGIATVRVQDVPALALPDAGGPGVTGIQFTGAALVAIAVLAGAFVAVRRRHPSGQGRKRSPASTSRNHTHEGALQ